MYPVRTVLKTRSGTLYRVIAIFADSSEIAYIELASKTAQPIVEQLSIFSETAKAQRWKPLTPTASGERPSGKLTEAAREVQKQRWSVVQPLLQDRRFFDAGTRSAAIDEAASACGVSTVHLRKLLRMAWQGGMTAQAMTPRYRFSGRPSGTGAGARGRPPKGRVYAVYAWTFEIREHAVKALRTRYLEDSTVTLEDVYDKLILEHFSYIDDAGTVEQLPLGQRPTIRQLRSVLEATLTPKERAARHSKADYENNWKPTIGHVMDDCLGAGDVYEIDASQVDVWLVAREYRRTVIGKATMYLVVDRYSRLIVGFYVSLDPPSWAGARQAILSIFTDKEALCREAGVPYNADDWPAHGLMPQRLFGDRGEMVCYASDMLTENLSIPVTNARALWSAGKGIVECTFKLIHVPMKRLRAGYEPARNTQIRRRKKYYKDAKLTISDMRGKLLRLVLNHNKRVHLTYQLPPEDIRLGRQPIPIEVFKRGVTEHMGLLSHFDEQDVRYELLETDEARVTQDGILYEFCFYSAPEALERHWFTRAAKRRFPVEVRVGALVDSIYIVDPLDPSNYFLATLTTYSQQFKGYTFAEVASLMHDLGINKRAGEEINLKQRLNKLVVDHERGLLTRDAPAKHRVKESPEQRTKDAREDRSTAQALPPAPKPSYANKEEAANAGPPAAAPPAPTSAPASVSSASASSQFLKNMFSEADDDLEP